MTDKERQKNNEEIDDKIFSSSIGELRDIVDFRPCECYDGGATYQVSFTTRYTNLFVLSSEQIRFSKNFAGVFKANMISTLISMREKIDGKIKELKKVKV